MVLPDDGEGLTAVPTAGLVVSEKPHLLAFSSALFSRPPFVVKRALVNSLVYARTCLP